MNVLCIVVEVFVFIDFSMKDALKNPNYCMYGHNRDKHSNRHMVLTSVLYPNFHKHTETQLSQVVHNPIQHGNHGRNNRRYPEKHFENHNPDI